MTLVRSISLSACLLLVACGGEDNPQNDPADAGDGDGDKGDGDKGDGDTGDGDTGDGDMGDGDADAGGNGGDGDAGGHGGDGDAGGGHNNQLTFNGYPVADHCSAGVYHKEYPATCSGANETSALAAGISDNTSVDVSVDWIALPSPNTSGKPYAVSVEIGDIEADFADWKIELWGVNSECAKSGGTADKLVSMPIDKGRGVYCLQATSTKTYSHLLIAYRQLTAGDGFINYGYTVCNAGKCPTP